MTKGEAMTAITRGLPYPQHISELDLDSQPDTIRFTWRGDRFRLGYANGIHVEEVQGGILAGSNIAILVEQCIRTAWVFPGPRVPTRDGQ